MSYKIQIELESNNEIEQEIYSGNMWYNKLKFDSVSMFTNKIEITLQRNKPIDIEKVLLNQNSSISKQINKCMAIMYAKSNVSIKIKNINICKYKKNILIDEYRYDKINNPIIPNKRNLIFEIKDLKVVFSNNIEKAEAITIALIFFLKAMSIREEGEKFENYWKSFNSLYTYISKETKEKDKLIYMRNFICSNLDKFNKSLELVDKQTKENIRSIRMRDLIINDFPSIKNTDSFKEFILRYTDYRMNEIFKEILPYRRENLRQKGIESQVNNHIQKYINERIKENSDLLCFYILKYSYYLRNKYFHAEKLTPTFNFVRNNENIELEMINEIFETFLYELIKCNSLY